MSITPKALTSAVLAGSALVAAAPAAAQADGFGCTASAVRGTVLGATVEPVTAGTPDGCASAERALDTLGLPLGADAAAARTGVANGAATSGTALKTFRVGGLAGLAPELPQIELPAGLDALAVPLPVAASLVGLPPVLTVDARRAAQALVTERRLPDVPLVGAELIETAASASCSAAGVVFDGLASVQRLTALGAGLDTSRAGERLVPLVSGDRVDLATLDPGLIELPAGLSLDDPVVGPIVRTSLEAVVAGLPAVEVPAEVARVQVDPAERHEGGASLRQLGPRVRVSVLGREVADLRLGDALVSVLGDPCARPADALAPLAAASALAAPREPEPTVGPAAASALACAPSGVVLTDVVEKDGKVKLVGVAAGRFVGRTVDLVLTHSGKAVAQAVVRPDGSFRARGPLPAQRIRFTNDARYQARVGGERSMALKLHRRMRISRMKPAGETVTIAGRILGRMGDRRVTILRRESCTKDVEVREVTPDPDGRWRVTLPVPEGVDAATFRATTAVRKGESPKRFRTYTLPGHVAL